MANLTHLLWLDTETTGLFPGHHEVMQVGGQISDLEGTLLRADGVIEIHQRVHHPERMQEGAIARHGIADPYEWNQRPGCEVAGIARFRDWLQRPRPGISRMVLAGWNPGFDERMLRQNPTPYSDLSILELSNFDYHMFDVWSIAFAVLGPEARSLEACAALLGLDAPPHAALGDADLARRVWIALRSRLAA